MAPCATSNRFAVGGVGDVSAMLDPAGQDLFLFVSQYAAGPALQGVAVARLAWADRDAPAGKITVWRDVWLPAALVDERWEYPIGTPLVRVSHPWHDVDQAADAFWGPSVHWNTYLSRYVMLLNRAKDGNYRSEGIYISYSSSLDPPTKWSPPVKILNGGTWYPQVIGLDTGAGTDKVAGEWARFYMMGTSHHLLHFIK